jgi:hypothetical protein
VLLVVGGESRVLVGRSEAAMRRAFRQAMEAKL